MNAFEYKIFTILNNSSTIASSGCEILTEHILKGIQDEIQQAITEEWKREYGVNMDAGGTNLYFIRGFVKSAIENYTKQSKTLNE